MPPRRHGIPPWSTCSAQSCRKPEHEALIDIRTLEIIAGTLPKRALALTIEWAVEHRTELMEDWELCQAKQLPKKIAPLE